MKLRILFVVFLWLILLVNAIPSAHAEAGSLTTVFEQSVEVRIQSWKLVSQTQFVANGTKGESIHLWKAAKNSKKATVAVKDYKKTTVAYQEVSSAEMNDLIELISSGTAKCPAVLSYNRVSRELISLGTLCN